MNTNRDVPQVRHGRYRLAHRSLQDSVTYGVADVLTARPRTVDDFEPKMLLREDADLVAVFTIKLGGHTIDGTDHMHELGDRFISIPIRRPFRSNRRSSSAPACVRQ